MDVLVDLLGWFNTERTTAVVAVLALAGIAYSAQSASAAKRQAKSAKDQAERAKEQVELGRQQVDLLMRQVRQAEAVEAATQQARRESLQPNVLVDIAPGVNDPGVFVLSISNIGASVARNVRVKALDEMVRSDGLKLHELTVFTEPISVMPPGQTRQFFYDVSFQPFKGNSPLWCRFEVDCDGPFGPVETASYDLDLSRTRGVGLLRPHSIRWFSRSRRQCRRSTQSAKPSETTAALHETHLSARSSSRRSWKMTRRLGGRLTRIDAELDRAQRTAEKQVDLVGEPGRGMSAKEAAQPTLIGRTHLPR